ncbi:GGDEF domain-containing protein [Shewanella sp. HL-SH2]|uniref:GGDEF domain-containing protein n=1 Tax=Shewanella sp. HL-SH2 TaxID=3436238 RepID=UPI003EB76F7B
MTFEQQLHNETQLYLKKSFIGLKLLSLGLLLLVLINRPWYIYGEIPLTNMLLSMLPLMLSLFLTDTIASKLLPKKINSSYFSFIFLFLSWLIFTTSLLIYSASFIGAAITITDMLVLAFGISLFPNRAMFFSIIAILSAYHLSINVLYVTSELWFSGIRLLCFVVIVFAGHHVTETWFKRAIQKDIDNQRLIKELEELAIKDGLTQIANRRHFDDVINKEIANSERTKQPLAIILIDIDFFKKLNDSLGHQQGDKCLISFANMLKNIVHRPRDLCARYGGEEFILLLAETDLAGAIIVAEKVKQQLEQLAILHPDSSVSDKVTVSQGIAVLLPGMSADELCHLADEKLYQVKRTSRNHFAY